MVKKISVFVEKIENGLIRLDAVKPARGTFFIPEKSVPFSLKEGMWLQVSFKVDDKARKEAVNRIVKLQQILQQKGKANG